MKSYNTYNCYKTIVKSQITVKAKTGFPLHLKNEILQLFPDYIRKFSPTIPNHIQIIILQHMFTYNNSMDLPEQATELELKNVRIIMQLLKNTHDI